MTTFALLSILVTAGALFSVLSFRVLRLPTTIGTMMLAMGAAAGLIVVGQWAPGLRGAAERVVSGIDFNAVVLHGMLALLLFAGALQLDLEHLAKQKLPVLVLSVVTTALSTVFVAGLFYEAMRWIHLPVSGMGALLFGALISPTDPIAVLDMLRRAGAPPALEVQLAGESLFNDGVGAVIFLALLGASGGGRHLSASVFGSLLLLKAGGGIALGVGLGYVTYRLLRLVDSYRVEVMLTLALAMGGYALADALNLSAPLEVVAAGLLVSGRARSLAMSELTREHVDRFWELVDDLMNVVLFLLLGLEILVLPFTWGHVLAGLVAIPVVLAARFASVGLSAGGLALFRKHVPRSIVVLSWGGLRGGLAVALALGLPSGLGLERNLLLVVTFVVVVFSILVQGLTLSRLLRRMHMA
ncbi:MAG: sodium:proton antiporter [Acidobacteriota bacterium]|nr:sodium:proton antiporter [Acidobacteriota bacterium]